MKEKELYDFLEKRIDGLKKHERRKRDANQRKVYDEVFDHSTLLTIYNLVKDGVLDTVEFPISTGKEGNVFYALTPEGEPLALKIYRINTATFKHIAKYIDGDPRFRVGKNRREMLFTWAQKEFRNLKIMEGLGFPSPRPIAHRKNIVAMEYIGNNDRPAPLIREVEVKDPQKDFEFLLDSVKTLLQDGKLVHGDLSEYNILYNEGKPVIIDVGQAVSVRHPSAGEFLERDVSNLVKFFIRLGVKADARDALEYVMQPKK